MVGPAQKAAEWAKTSFPVLPARVPSPAAFVTYHPDYHSFDPPRVLASLVAARQLGVGWIRTDIRWHYLVPDSSHVDGGALAWYGDFLGAVRKCQLKSVVVLGTPPPDVLTQQPQERLDSWSRFVEIAARELGARCDVFQLMNEVNNPAYGFLPLKDTARALVRGAAIVRAHLLDATVAINVTMDLWGWEDYLERLLDLSARAVDIVGLDHYPGTWTVGIHERWSRIVGLARAIASAPLSSPWHGRRLAIMETGFSTNFIGRGEVRQAEYFEGVVKVAQRLKETNRGEDPFLGIYELCDENSQSWLDPEAHFGLLTSDLRPKRAFAMMANALDLL